MDGVQDLPLQKGQQAAVQCWWPAKGLRSPDDVDRICSYIADIWSSQGPFDGILGFSQGAACALLLVRLSELGRIRLPGLSFLVLAGAYLPDMTGPPATKELSCVHSLSECSIPALHFAGRKDRAVPVAESQAAASRFAASSRGVLHIHDGGHEFPQKSDSASAFVTFLARFCGSEQRRGGQDPAQRAKIDSAEVSVAQSETLNPTEPTKVGAGVAGEWSVHKSSPYSPGEFEEALQEELESVEACFVDEFHVITPLNPGPPEIRVQLHFTGSSKDADLLSLHVLLPSGYPHNARPLFEFQTQKREAGRENANAPWTAALQNTSYSDYPKQAIAAAERAIEEVFDDNPAQHTLLQIIAAGQDAIEDFFADPQAVAALPKPSTSDIPSAKLNPVAKKLAAVPTVDESLPLTEWWNEEFEYVDPSEEHGDIATHGARTDMIQSALDKAAAIANQHEHEMQGKPQPQYASGHHGQWDFVVGLVGKPSAGKSTFFNAASRCVPRCCKLTTRSCRVSID